MLMGTNLLEEWAGLRTSSKATMVDWCLSGYKKCIIYRYSTDIFYTSEDTHCAEDESVFIIFEPIDLYENNRHLSANFHLCQSLARIKNFYN